MKKIIVLLFALFLSTAHAQTFKVQNLNVLGTTTLATPPAVSGDCQNVAAYGALTSATDNSAALMGALAAAPAGHACAYFPPGTYKFASAVNYSVSGTPGSITIEGAGADVTTLLFPTTSGITINLTSPYHTFHVRDVTFAGGSANANNGLVVNQSSPEGAFFQSDVTNVSFRGNVPGGLGWANAFTSNGVSAISFVSDYFLANTNSISLQPSVNSPFYGQDYNIVNSTFFGVTGQVGIIYGSYIQALEVSNNYFVNLGIAIAVPPSELGFLEGFQFTGNSVATQNVALALNTAVANVSIANNLFTSATVNSNTLISFGAASNFTISGNTFNSTGTMSGIFVQGTTAGSASVITGNSFQALNSAINLAATATGVNVQSNAYQGNTSNVTNLGTGNTIGGGSQ